MATITKPIVKDESFNEQSERIAEALEAIAAGGGSGGRDAGSITYNPVADYESGTVGKAITDTVVSIAKIINLLSNAAWINNNGRLKLEALKDDLSIQDVIPYDDYYNPNPRTAYDSLGIDLHKVALSNNVPSKMMFIGEYDGKSQGVIDGVRINNYNTIQAFMYDDRKLYVFYASSNSSKKACLDVVDLSTLICEHRYEIGVTDPYFHGNSCEWVVKGSKFILPGPGEGPYVSVVDITDTTSITVDTIALSDIGDEAPTIAYDTETNTLYALLYDDAATRANTVIYSFDFTDYLTSGSTTLTPTRSITVASKHIQDCAFYDGDIYVATDSTTGANSKSLFGFQKIDLSNETEKLYEIPLPNYRGYYEAEGIAWVDDVSAPYMLIGDSITYQSVYIYQAIP